MAVAEDDVLWLLQTKGGVMSEDLLRQHHAVWDSKPVLRYLYTEWYREIVSWLCPGRTLEVGGGTGNLKQFLPGAYCTDVVRLPWLDAVADAQRLPFATKSLANIVLFDTLHHIENIRFFFDEALRVLEPHGRVVIMDPYISVCSWPVYHFLHPEPVDLRQNPLELCPSVTNREPFDANQAIATLLFERFFNQFAALYPQFRQLYHRRLAFWAYPLSGGFDHPSFLPLWLVRPTLWLEQTLGFLNRLCAFRVLVVLEKCQ